MINSLMRQLSAFLGVEIILANQDAPQPVSPFGTYKIIGSDIEKPHQRIRKQSDAGDNTVSINYIYDRSTVVQLSFYNKGESGDLQDIILGYAEKAWIWINEQGREICRLSNAVPMIVSERITPEVTVSENKNEYRVSFDFAVKGKIENIYTIETITGVIYTFDIKK